MFNFDLLLMINLMMRDLIFAVTQFMIILDFFMRSFFCIEFVSWQFFIYDKLFYFCLFISLLSILMKARIYLLKRNEWKIKYIVYRYFYWALKVLVQVFQKDDPLIFFICAATTRQTKKIRVPKRFQSPSKLYKFIKF